MKNILTHHRTRIELGLTLNQAAVIDELHRECGYYCPSGEVTSDKIPDIAERINLSDRTVRSIISELIELGLVVNLGEADRKNRFICKPSENYIRNIRE